MSQRRRSVFIGDSSQFTHFTHVRESRPAEKNCPASVQEIEAGALSADGDVPQGNPTCTARPTPITQLASQHRDERLLSFGASMDARYTLFSRYLFKRGKAGY